MSSRETVPLGALLKPKNGYIRGPFGSALRRPEMKKVGIPVYEQQNAIYNNRIFRFYVDPSKQVELKRFTVEPGDLVISCSGTLGKITVIKNDDPIGIISQALLILRPDLSKVKSDFLYYFLTSPIGQYLLLGASHGSVQTNIAKREVVENLQIPTLEIEEQEKIVKVLSDLDQKIELNRKMNKTLEEMGQALFKHYFIDNPEAKGWESKKLGQLVSLVNGASYKSSELQSSENALVSLKSFKRGGGFRRDGFKEFTGKIKDDQIVVSGNLVVAHTDVTQLAEVAGVPALVSGVGKYNKVGISMDVVKVVPTDETITTGFLYFLMRNRLFQEHKMGYVSGTTVLHLNKRCIPDFEIRLPDQNTLKKISSVFENLTERMSSNDNQIDFLSDLRDSLLPRLMSGKISV